MSGGGGTGGGTWGGGLSALGIDGRKALKRAAKAAAAADAKLGERRDQMPGDVDGVGNGEEEDDDYDETRTEEEDEEEEEGGGGEFGASASQLDAAAGSPTVHTPRSVCRTQANLHSRRLFASLSPSTTTTTLNV